MTTCGRLRRAVEPDRPIPGWAQAHLAECTACQAYLDDMGQLRRALATLADVPVPEDFGHRLRARLHASTVSSARTFAVWPRALALVALGGLAFALLFTLGGERHTVPDEVHIARPPAVNPTTAPISSASPSATPQARSSQLSEITRSKEHDSLPSLAHSDHPRSPSTTTVSLAEKLEGSSAEFSRTNLVDLLDDSSLQDGVVLLLRNEETQEESVLAIPPVVFGSRPLIPRPTPALREEQRRIL